MKTILDICFTEFGSQPTALVFTEKGQIIAINMVTFRTNTILKTTLAPNMKCTSMSLTLTYLILAIENYGVIVYNFPNLKDPIGVLALGGFQYAVTCNQSGSVSVTEKENARSVTNIFKLSRI